MSSTNWIWYQDQSEAECSRRKYERAHTKAAAKSDLAGNEHGILVNSWTAGGDLEEIARLHKVIEDKPPDGLRQEHGITQNLTDKETEV